MIYESIVVQSETLDEREKCRPDLCRCKWLAKCLEAAAVPFPHLVFALEEKGRDIWPWLHLLDGFG